MNARKRRKLSVLGIVLGVNVMDKIRNQGKDGETIFFLKTTHSEGGYGQVGKDLDRDEFKSTKQLV